MFSPSSLDEEESKELYADKLSDVPSDYDDTCSETDSDDDNSSTSSDSPDESRLPSSSTKKEENCKNDDVWLQNDPPRNLEKFIGVQGRTYVPGDPVSIPELVNRVFGEEFFQSMCFQSNLYRKQLSDKYGANDESDSCEEITVDDMKKFVSVLILMFVKRKEMFNDMWRKNPIVTSSKFAKVMSFERWEQIFKFWHFNDNTQLVDGDRLHKIRPIFDYIVGKCQALYKPSQNLAVGESFIGWGNRDFAMIEYDPEKYAKYGLFAKMVTESKTGYVCNIELLSAEEDKLVQTTLSVMGPYLGLWHHVYLANFYNSLDVVEALLSKNTRACGTLRDNDKDIPTSLSEEAKLLNRYQCTFRRKNEVLLHVWKDREVEYMVTTIHNAKNEDSGKMNRRRQKIMKPVSAIQFEKEIKAVGRANNFLEYYTILEENIKWSKKVAVFLINCALFNSFHLYQTQNPGTKLRYSKFLLNVAEYLHGDLGNDESPAPVSDSE